MPEDLLKVYTYNIRLVLEYAAQVWQDIPAYLSDAIESNTKKSFKNNISKLWLSTSSRPSKFDVVRRSQDIHMQEVDGGYYEE